MKAWSARGDVKSIRRGPLYVDSVRLMGVTADLATDQPATASVTHIFANLSVYQYADKSYPVLVRRTTDLARR